MKFEIGDLVKYNVVAHGSSPIKYMPYGINGNPLGVITKCPRIEKEMKVEEMPPEVRLPNETFSGRSLMTTFVLPVEYRVFFYELGKERYIQAKYLDAVE